MRRFVLIAVVALASLAGARGRAAEDQSKAIPGSDRQLAGHVFTPSRLVLPPFTTTYFGSVTVFGLGTGETNDIDIDGNIVGRRDEDVAGFGEGFDFSYRFADWLAIRAAASGSFYSGTSGRSFLVVGTTAQFYAALGATLAHTFAPNLRAALTFDVSQQPAYDLLIANGIVETVRRGDFATDALFQEGTRVRAQPGVSLAWAPHPAVGLVGTAAFIWSRRTSGGGEREQTGSAFGISGDLDLGRLTPVPIALLAVYHWEGAGGLARLQDVGGGVFYSGRPNLQLGLEVAFRDQTLRDDVEGEIPLEATLAAVVLRYYW